MTREDESGFKFSLTKGKRQSPEKNVLDPLVLERDPIVLRKDVQRHKCPEVVRKLLATEPENVKEKAEQSFFKKAITFISFFISDITAVTLVVGFIHWLIHKTVSPLHILPYPALYTAFALGERLFSNSFTFWDEVWKLLKASVFSTFAVTVVWFFGGNIFFPGPWLSLVLPVALTVSLTGARWITKKILWFAGIRKRIVIIGGGQACRKIIRALESEKGLNCDIVGVLDDDKEKILKPVGKFRGKDVLVIGETGDLWNLVEELDIDEVIIAIPSMGDKHLTELALHLQKYIPTVTVVPDFFGLPITVQLGHFFGEQTIFLSVKNNLSNPLNRAIKEIFDRLFALVVLILVSPILLVSAIAVKLSSPGPIIFAQERIGKGGRRFKCYKLRTMYQDSDRILEEYFRTHPEHYEIFVKTGKIPEKDPRITPVGRILRKLSIDELPQFFNVLKGDMSVVGPRALVPDEVETCKEYYLEWAKYVKPGITGLAQIMGRANISHTDKNIISLWYVKNWSLWLDIVIILKTIKVVLKGEGAY